jgi:bifunctional non-homologous end joining protein LigD
MIQTHDADRAGMHTDFRLFDEKSGVYRSWAIPKGMPITKGQRVLAVPQPDHDPDYMLEGTFEPGEYGAGTVLLYDQGEWSEKDPQENNKISFILEGDRLSGVWTLVKPAVGKDWLMVCTSASKKPGWGDDQSVLSGRTLSEIAEDGPWKPMLAKLVPYIPDATLGSYIYEPKLDGYRAIARRKGASVQLFSRAGKDISARHPRVIKALEALTWDGVLDGEITYGDTFQDTQRREGAVRYNLFDKPDQLGTLLERKETLKTLFKGSRVIKVVPHKTKPFDPCAQNLEGLIAKDPNSQYKPGARGPEWLKYKCKNRQEFIVAGFTEGSGKKRGMIGSLLLGYYSDGIVRYAGSVGTGLGDDAAVELFNSLSQKLVSESPLSDGPQRGRWVNPELVVEVEFLEWTNDGRLRQPVVLGVRDDKNPHEVTREQAMTHVTKILFPEAEVDKAELAKYYAQVADRMLPELKDRPLTLYRCPNGVENDCFFQRYALSGIVPKGLEVVEIDGKKYYSVKDAEGLRSLTQLNVVEIHTWNTRGNQPDRVVFDLDPGDEVEWSQLTEVAYKVRDKLAEQGTKSFVKTSGNKGVHIFVPVEEVSSSEARLFAQQVAEAVVRDIPDKATTTPSKRSRTGRVYIDWLRNDLGATTVAPWSTRARSDAPVSTPINWDDLPNVRGDSFNTNTAPQAADAWATLTSMAQTLGTLL